MPKMMNTLAEILVAQDIEAGRINLNAEEVEATSSDSFSLEESSLDEEDDREAVAEDEAVDENGETGRGAE